MQQRKGVVEHRAQGISKGQIERLGAALTNVMPVRSFFRATGPSSPHWLYLLFGLHRRSLFELWRGPLYWRPSRTSETYLRIGFSASQPVAVVQEVQLLAQLEPDTTVLTEKPWMGVVDQRLGPWVKALQGEIRQENIQLIDMAWLIEPITIQSKNTSLWEELFEDSHPCTETVICLGTAKTQKNNSVRSGRGRDAR